MDVTRQELEKRYKTLIQTAKVLEAIGLERFFKLNTLLSEMINLKIDPVMNLPVRVEWFRILKSRLLQMYPFIQNWDSCESEDILDDITSNTFETGFFVVFGDVSYLNLVNKLGGHKEGDRFLKEIAGAFAVRQSKTVTSGRLGGDEIAILFESIDDESVRIICEDIEREVSQNVYEIGGREIIPSVDLGRSDLQESLFVLYRVIEEGQAPEPDSRVSFVLNSLMHIADKRADFYKRLRRIYLLTALFINHRSLYEEYIDYMRKGVGNISDEKIADLAELKRSMNDGEFKGFVTTYILAEITKNDSALSLRDGIERELALSIFL